MKSSPAKSLTFNDIKIKTTINNGQIWLSASELANALGYKNNRSISKIYNANKDEFNDSMTTITKSVINGINNSKRTIEVRIFSLRGCHLMAMFSRTKVAKEFRKWVLDILDKETLQTIHQTTIDERAGLRDAVEKLARKKKGLNYPDAYSMIHQYMNVKHIDEIPREKIKTAIAYCHKVALEGEIIPAESVEDKKPDYNYPLETADPSTREFANANLTHDVILNERRPEWELVLQLEKDGYDVTGVKVRIDAMYKLVGWYREQQDELKEIAFRMGRLASTTYSLTEHRGKNVRFA